MASEITLKVLLLGDTCVGKTSLMEKFVNNKFSNSYIATMGVDYRKKTLKLESTIIHMQIWDTAGQERYHALATSYYRGADAIILVYDVTSQSTFESVAQWLNQIKTYAPPSVYVVLVGNKIDLDESRVVAKSRAIQLAEQNNLRYYETSAKEGIDVSRAFKHIARVKVPAVSVASMTSMASMVSVAGSEKVNLVQDAAEDDDELAPGQKKKGRSSCCG